MLRGKGLLHELGATEKTLIAILLFPIVLKFVVHQFCHKSCYQMTALRELIRVPKWNFECSSFNQKKQSWKCYQTGCFFVCLFYCLREDDNWIRKVGCGSEIWTRATRTFNGYDSSRENASYDYEWKTTLTKDEHCIYPEASCKWETGNIENAFVVNSVNKTTNNRKHKTSN